MLNRLKSSAVFDLDSREAPSRHGDRLFLLALSLLCVAGLVMVYSASFSKGLEVYRDPFYYLKEHALRLGIGAMLFFFAYQWDYHRYRRWSLWLLAGCLVLLIAVLFVGSGAHRWIRLLGLTVQPSEFARVALVVYLADWCSRHSHRLQKDWRAYLFAVSSLLIPVGLVVLEPSFSASAMMALAGFALLFFAGARFKHLWMTILPALPLGLGIAILEPYRLKRILTFFNPLADPQGAGYQSNQSLIAVGSGQIFGVGLGWSGQKNQFLPEAHCDFIYSILCEELGFIGGAIILILFLLLVWRGLKIARHAPDQFGFLLAGGLAFSIILFILANVGVALGLVPVTGLPLPFISFGGSALIANLTACGIILNVSRHAQSPEFI